jgi:tRNA (guanine37-N1)-methyltransferase
MKNKEIFFIKIKKKDGQEFFKLLNKNFKKYNIINPKFKVERDFDFILFPLREDNIKIENLINQIPVKIPFEVISKEGKLNSKFKPKTLYDILKNEITDEFLELIPKSYDILGRIAIVEFENFKNISEKRIKTIKKKIAKAIIQLNKKVETVFEKKSEIKGNYRIRELEFLKGVKNSETVYKENNCIFKLDVEKTFFTPRLIYERKRISECNINENELIIDLFAGVGTFSIQIAKKHDVNIYSFDINPLAYHYLRENLESNQLKGHIYPFNMDITLLLEPSNELREKLNNKADRIIMNLPESAINFIDVACILMKKSGGILHIYQFCEKPDPIKEALEKVAKTLDKFNWNIKAILESKIVKPYSPKSDMVVIDAVIEYLDK